jgi:hypothetical protein
VRRIAAIALVTLAPLTIGAAVPEVGYEVEATVGTWQPIAAVDLAKTVEQSVLEVLSKPGLVQLKKLKKDSAQSDYRIEIRARILDEAETETVSLAFVPAGRSDLPSFNAARTISLSKLQRPAMLQKIDESARKAAADLLAVLRPSLERIASARSLESTGKGLPWPNELPFRWAEVTLDAPKGGSTAELASSKSEVRSAAVRSLASRVLLGESAARQMLEGCVLEHKSPEVRRSCLIALRPATRRFPSTQRVVIEAFRKDGSAEVKTEASEQMLYFSGFSRSEAIQAWLEAASEGSVVGPLAQLGDLPNLDVVIYRCLIASGKRPKYQRSKRSCIELLPPLSIERKKAILGKFLAEADPDSPYYLEGAGERENSTGTDWQWAVEAVLEGETVWDPGLGEILWRRYRRDLSHVALQTLAEYSPPSPELADRLIEALQTGGHHSILPALERMAKLDPALKAKIRENIAELLHTGNYSKSTRPYDLEQLVKKLGEAK